MIVETKIAALNSFVKSQRENLDFSHMYNEKKNGGFAKRVRERKQHLNSDLVSRFFCQIIAVSPLNSKIPEVHSVKMVAAGVIKQVTIPSEKPVSNIEFDFSKLPTEILVKIYGYLDILGISRCAQVSKSFNLISKDSLLLKSWEKLSIKEKNVSTEFLGYIFKRGITELNLSLCEILPPKVRLLKDLKSEPLNLKTLSLDGTSGDKTLLNEIITSHPMENIDIRRSMNMYLSNNISLFIKCLPKIGSQLKSLNLEYGGLNRYRGANSIPLIVDNCLGLEELNISYNILSQESITYLFENLTPNILKLDMRINLIYKYIMNDNHIRALVKRCPKLKVLDIRTTYSKVTYQGLVAISEGLLFLESLGFSKTIEDELGLPNNINLTKMEKLKSMKNLKELLIGLLSNTAEYQSILEREIPNLRENGFSLERKLLTGKLTKVITLQEPASLCFYIRCLFSLLK